MSEKRLTVREACRQRKPLDGSDAQALEGALTQVENDLAEVRQRYEVMESACGKALNDRDRCGAALEAATELLRQASLLYKGYGLIANPPGGIPGRYPAYEGDINQGTWINAIDAFLDKRAEEGMRKMGFTESKPCTKTDLTLRELQEQQRAWVAHNFGVRPSWHPLLGAVEELGELAHAHLKQTQGIRINENHEENAKDAVADVVIYLADYCSARGFDFQEIVERTWEKVKKRDWKKNPGTANVEPDSTR